MSSFDYSIDKGSCLIVNDNGIGKPTYARVIHVVEPRDSEVSKPLIVKYTPNGLGFQLCQFTKDGIRGTAGLCHLENIKEG